MSEAIIFITRNRNESFLKKESLLSIKSGKYDTKKWVHTKEQFQLNTKRKLHGRGSERVCEQFFYLKPTKFFAD